MRHSPPSFRGAPSGANPESSKAENPNVLDSGFARFVSAPEMTPEKFCHRAISAATANTSQLAIRIVPPAGAAIGNSREPI